MSLLQEEKIDLQNPHEQFKLQDLEKGESLGFYWVNMRTATSDEYGDFNVMEGLQVDLTADSEEAILESAKAISTVPNTMLQNNIDQGGMVRGDLYRLEKAWDKGEKFKTGKAKGYGYNTYRIKAPESLLNKLASAYRAKINPNNMGEESSEETSKPNL
jgi:hypothetical protein